MVKFNDALPNSFRHLVFQALGNTPRGLLLALPLAEYPEDVLEAFRALQNRPRGPDELIVPHEMCRLTDPSIKDPNHGHCIPWDNIFDSHFESDPLCLGDDEVPLCSINKGLYPFIAKLGAMAENNEIHGDAQEIINMLTVRQVHES